MGNSEYCKQHKEIMKWVTEYFKGEEVQTDMQFERDTRPYSQNRK